MSPWKNPLLPLLTSALMLSGTAAFADPVAEGPFSTPYSGGYVGAGWGQFNLHLHDLDDVGTAATSVAHSRDNAWKAFLGYRFNPYIAVEGAYIDFGHPGDDFTASGANGRYRAHLDGWAPYLVGTAPLGPIELFGKVGYYIYNVDLQAHFSDSALPDVDSSHSRSDLLYGGGVGLTFLGHLTARAEYEILDARHAPNSDAFWLSAAWRF